MTPQDRLEVEYVVRKTEIYDVGEDGMQYSLLQKVLSCYVRDHEAASSSQNSCNAPPFVTVTSTCIRCPPRRHHAEGFRVVHYWRETSHRVIHVVVFVVHWNSMFKDNYALVLPPTMCSMLSRVYYM
jgi:hypothetical protein